MSREDLHAEAFRHQGAVTVYEPGDATRKITVAEDDLVEDPDAFADEPRQSLPA